MSVPDPKVIPKKNWGAFKNLFVRGYIKIKTAITNEIWTVVFGTNSKRLKQEDANMKKNIHAPFRLTSPLAMGLFFVLETNLSNLWSLISLITQPQDLARIAPANTIR